MEAVAQAPALPGPSDRCLCCYHRAYAPAHPWPAVWHDICERGPVPGHDYDGLEHGSASVAGSRLAILGHGVGEATASRAVLPCPCRRCCGGGASRGGSAGDRRHHQGQRFDKACAGRGLLPSARALGGWWSWLDVPESADQEAAMGSPGSASTAILRRQPRPGQDLRAAFPLLTTSHLMMEGPCMETHRPLVLSVKDMAQAVENAVRLVAARHNVAFTPELKIYPGLIIGRQIRQANLTFQQAEQIATEITDQLAQEPAAPGDHVAISALSPEPLVVVKRGPIILTGYLPGPALELRE
jgi:hypothetical protein